jgi:hypothetical protein
LNDQPLPPTDRWINDQAEHCGPLPFAGTIAEEHAISLAKRALQGGSMRFPPGFAG